MIWLSIILGSLILAEFYGYWLHVLLHSYWIPTLSRSHMNHHILSYPSGKNQRSKDYIKETGNDILIFGVGLEWLLPAVVLLVFTVAAEWFIGLSLAQITLSVSTIIIYTIFLFSILHDTFHVKDHPILKIKWLKKWYLKSRRLHDIHHHYIDDDGLMNKNYGIAFFFFDRLFKSYMPTMRGKYSKKNAERALDRLKKHTNFHR